MPCFTPGWPVLSLSLPGCQLNANRDCWCCMHVRTYGTTPLNRHYDPKTQFVASGFVKMLACCLRVCTPCSCRIVLPVLAWMTARSLIGDGWMPATYPGFKIHQSTNQPTNQPTNHQPKNQSISPTTTATTTRQQIAVMCAGHMGGLHVGTHVFLHHRLLVAFCFACLLAGPPGAVESKASGQAV